MLSKGQNLSLPAEVEQIDVVLGWTESEVEVDASAVFVDTDACVTPVLSLGEVPASPHLAARGTIIEIDGVAQPAPAPRFSRTKATAPTGPRRAGADTATVIADWIGSTARQ